MTDAAAAFPRIVREHRDRVFSLSLRLCGGDRAAAEDLAHDVFVKAYRAFAGYDRARRSALALRPWLATIALNEARNRSRAASRRRDRVSPDGALPERIDTTPDATVHVDRRAAVVAALDALPAAQREAVVLRHIGDLSYAQIGEALGRPVATVRSDVHRAHATLRTLLKEDT